MPTDRMDEHLLLSGEHLQKVVYYADVLGDKKSTASSRLNLSDVFYRQGRFQDALECAQACLRDFKAVGDASGERAAASAIALFGPLVRQREGQSPDTIIGIQCTKQPGDE